MDRAILRIVDRIPGSCVCEELSRREAIFDFSLASFRSSFSSPEGSHITVTVFPLFLGSDRLIDLAYVFLSRLLSR